MFIESISTILAVFLWCVAFGMPIFSFIVHEKLVGTGFYKILYSVNLSFVGIIFFTYQTKILDSQLLLFSNITYAVVIFLIFHCLRKNLLLLHKILRVVMVLVLAVYFIQLYDFNLDQYIYLYISALFIGSCCFGLLLGHWHLVVPKLSEKYLKLNNMFTLILLGVKILYFTRSSIVFLKQYQSNNPYFSFIEGPFFLLGLKLLWGPIILLVLLVLTHQLIKIRSLQSATGVLYVVVFFMIFGENLGLYLFLRYGILV